MTTAESIKKRILHGPVDFDGMAMDVFRHQALHNPVYRQFLYNLRVKPGDVENPGQIPFLPIGFFKTHEVIGEGLEPSLVFTSSGTTGQAPSRHLVADAEFCRSVFLKGFEHFYGDISRYAFLALLPSYLERSGSSLVLMARELIAESRHPAGGFFLHDLQALRDQVLKLEHEKQEVILLGVTYALLDLAERYPMPLHHTTVMETGGMKGRRKELLKEEVHLKLKDAFRLKAIHSEYGMTELLSQAYSKGDGKFYCPPWMHTGVKDIHDPAGPMVMEKTGLVHVIDLANMDSCSFIATEDLGKAYPDGSFEILGRLDNSDLRGCNLLVD